MWYFFHKVDADIIFPSDGTALWSEFKMFA